MLRCGTLAELKAFTVTVAKKVEAKVDMIGRTRWACCVVRTRTSNSNRPAMPRVDDAAADSGRTATRVLIVAEPTTGGSLSRVEIEVGIP
jgi:hypothetical protein